MPLKWGIVSVGKISTEFTRSLLLFDKSEHELVAVAARDEERAQNFAKIYNIPVAYGNYELLASAEHVDIVYIGTIHPHHFELSKMMLEHGKHVLCEKPMTMNEIQTTELIRIAQDKKLFLMEGIWSRCFPVYDEIKNLINSGTIGDVMLVQASFGRKLSHIQRIYEKKLGGGTILDLGVYTLQFQQFIFQGSTPTNFVGSGHLNKEGADESACAIITYEGGKSAILATHAEVELPNEAVIIGTKGTLKVPIFWCPQSIITSQGTLKFELPVTEHTTNKPAGFTYEIIEVGRCIKEGLLESPKVPHKDSIELAKMMDQWRKIVGVIYDEDLSKMDKFK